MVKQLGIKVVKINISPILRGLGTSNLFLAAISGRSFWKEKVDKFMQRRGHSLKGDYIDTLKGSLEPKWRRLLTKITSKHRARVLVAYKYAEENNLLVVGSAHRTERMVGLFANMGLMIVLILCLYKIFIEAILFNWLNIWTSLMRSLTDLQIPIYYQE